MKRLLITSAPTKLWTKKMNTYSGTTLAIAEGVPSSLDRTGYLSMQFVTGSCALMEVPRMGRAWGKSSADLACAETNTELKTNAKWHPVIYRLASRAQDEAQEIYRALEKNPTGVGSFRLQLPDNLGAIYFTAQVKEFDIVGGGGKDAIQSGAVELLVQSEPVFVGDFRVPFGVTSSVQFRFDTVDSQPYAIDFNDGNGPQLFDSHVIHSHDFAISRSGFITISFEDAARIQYFRLMTGEFQLNLAELKEMPNLLTVLLTDTQAFGDISNLESLTRLSTFQGVFTDIHGDISSFAELEEMVNVYVHATNVDGEGASIVNGNYKRFRLGIGMTSNEVGDTISALNQAGVTNCIIELGFDNAPAPNAVLGDIDDLISRGCTITVN